MTLIKKNFETIWKDIVDFSDANDINLEPIRNVRKRKLPKKLEGFVVAPTTEVRDEEEFTGDTAAEFWKKTMYLKIMNAITSNFEDRFKNLPLAEAVDSFLQLDLDGAKEFIDNYQKVAEINRSELEAEVKVFKGLLKSKNMEVNLQNMRVELRAETTPNLYKLVQIAVCIPTSSAGCERSFSAMRRIKTWLRSTMCQDRFSHMALLNIENSVVKENISNTKVLEIFMEKKRKMKLE